jgi:hypothetical protein
VGPWTKNVKKKARSLLFSFNLILQEVSRLYRREYVHHIFRPEPGPWRFWFLKKNEVKKLKKKIYKKALAGKG